MNKLLLVSLHLFEGEGGGDAAPASGSEMGDEKLSGDADQKNAKQKVVYGKKPAAEKADVTASEPADDESEYKELIKGKYKDFYTRDTQQLINRRFKETKDLEAKFGKAQPILSTLMAKYGIEGDDIDALSKAIDEDDSYWEERADSAGMTVEQYKQIEKLKAQNNELLKEQAARRGQEQAEEQVKKWVAEAEEAKAKYPNFDLNAESQNPEFAALIKSGIPVLKAFEVTHIDDLMAYSAKATEKRVTDSIRAKGMRPRENGASSQSAVIYKDDVTKFTRKDREEAIRRSMMGEKIEF